MRIPVVVPCVLALSLAVFPAVRAADAPALGDLSKVGTVAFPTSCEAQVQPDFLRGVALLHSFFYEEARRVFTSVAERDPGCAMAQWGVAMTWYHPLWAAPTETELKAGLEAVQKAEGAAGASSQRERDYIGAVAAYYRAGQGSGSGPVGQSCHGPTDQGTRRAAFARAMERLHATYPDDVEAAAFHALSLIQSSPTKDELPKQLEAAAILEALWKQHPDHPGLVHLPDAPPARRWAQARGLAELLQAGARVGLQRFEDFPVNLVHADELSAFS